MVEPDATPPDDDEAIEAIEAMRKKRSRRRGLLSWIGIAVLAVCVVGSAAGYVWYDRKTKIDRTTPATVVFQYIDAIFDQRDPDRAELFECDGGQSREALQVLLDEIEAREARFDIRISVSTGRLITDARGTRADVDGELIVITPEANGDTSRLTQNWSFHLRDEDGWRVCSAERKP